MNQDRIDLGLAKKQATDKLRGQVLFPDEYEKSYKDWVKRFSRWNKELDAELLKAEEGAGSDTRVEIPITQNSSKPRPPTQLSDKQKRCPQCREAIPKTWQRHEKCGWKQ